MKPGRKMTRPVRCRGKDAKLCPAFKTIRRDFAVDLYATHGMSANEAGDLTGIGARYILASVREGGLQTRPRGGYRPRAERCE